MLELFKVGGAKSWIAPEIIQANRLPSRATTYPFPTEKLAQAGVAMVPFAQWRMGFPAHAAARRCTG
jgi:hypothetical protein